MRKTLSSRKPSTSVPGQTETPDKPAPKFTPRGTAKERLLVAVADDRIDFQSMSGESAKRFNELMHKPEVQQQFGIGPMTERFDPRHCKRVWEGVGHILMGLGGFVFKYPPEACEKFRFTEEEKDELAEPTAAALDELAPKWLRENQAVAALIVVASSIVQNKMRAAALEARRIAIERQQMVNAAAGSPPDGEPVRNLRVSPEPKANGGTRIIIPTAGSGIEPPPPPPSFGGTAGKVGA